MVWICELADAGGTTWAWLCEPCMTERQAAMERGMPRWLSVKAQMGPMVPWLTCDGCRAKAGPEQLDRGAGARLARAWTREPGRMARFVKDKKIVEMTLAEAAARSLL